MKTIPVLPIKNAVIYPGTAVPLRVGRGQSILAVRRADEEGKVLLAIAERRDTDGQEVRPEDLHQVGTLVKIEKLASCESKQSAPSVELPWLNAPSVVPPARSPKIRIERVTRPLINLPSKAQIAKLKKLQRFEMDAVKFNPRDREIILKTLHRSINLRIAS